MKKRISLEEIYKRAPQIDIKFNQQADELPDEAIAELIPIKDDGNYNPIDTFLTE